jgi:hypothetical protein
MNEKGAMPKPMNESTPLAYYPLNPLLSLICSLSSPFTLRIDSLFDSLSQKIFAPLLCALLSLLYRSLLIVFSANLEYNILENLSTSSLPTRNKAYHRQEGRDLVQSSLKLSRLICYFHRECASVLG